jgi:hypothetical protein
MDKICNFCNKEFSTKQALVLHIKTNKKCISSRPVTDEEQSIEIISFNCEICNKEFSRKNNLIRHLETCSKKKTIKELLAEVKPLVNNDSEELNRLKEELNELRKIKDDYNRLKSENENIKSEYNNLKENASEMNFELRLKDEQLRTKDEQLRTKDEQHIKDLKAKDEQLKAKDEIINVLQTFKSGSKKINNNTTNNNNTLNNTTNNTTNIYLEFANMTPINSEKIYKEINIAVGLAVEKELCPIKAMSKILIDNNAVKATSTKEQNANYYTVCDKPDGMSVINYGSPAQAIYEFIKLNEEISIISNKRVEDYNRENILSGNYNDGSFVVLHYLKNCHFILDTFTKPILNRQLSGLYNCVEINEELRKYFLEPIRNKTSTECNTNILISKGLVFDRTFILSK